MAFKKGQSGNPAGRTAGKTPAAELKKVIAENMPDILKVMMEQAKEGDTAAAKALMDKVIPSLKPQAIPVNIMIGENLQETGGHVINATLEGKVAPDVGSQLITALSNQAKLIELTELSQRLERIEQQLSSR